jgi:hypothetical protein
LPDRVVGDAHEHVGEPGLRIDVVELGRLCRAPNYAARARFPEVLRRPVVIGSA